MRASRVLQSSVSPHSGATAEAPIRDVLLGPAELNQCARDTARLHVTSPEPVRDRRLISTFETDYRHLDKSLRSIASWARARTALIRSAEWLLDNGYLVQEQAQEVRHNLPKSFYRELPKLVTGHLAGYPRVYAIAVELIAHTNADVSEERLIGFIDAYQSENALTSGELWALPIMVQIALIQNLQRLADEIVRNQRRRTAADTWADHLLDEIQKKHHLIAEVVIRHERPLGPLDPAYAVQLLQRFLDQGPNAAYLVEWLQERLGRQGASFDSITRQFHQDEAANVTSVKNCITSLRFISSYDWSDFFEQVSLLEQILREDPAQVYPRMDFETRDSYRHEVERLAKRSKVAETHVARQAIRLASDAAQREIQPARCHHVGYYLFGRGQRALRVRLGHHSGWLDRARRYVRRHPAPFYLGTIFAGTVALDGFLTSWVTHFGMGVVWLILLALLLVVPASDIIIHLLNQVLTRRIPPRLLPKLELKEGIPADLRTIVAVQTMLSTKEHLLQMIERMEVYYLANQEPHLHFALLADFHDAQEAELPGEEEILELARQEIQNLNDRYSNGETVFFFFHRKRLWNEAEGRWMGWERKRGKLEEFNRLLRGDRDTSFINGVESLTELSPIKYVITLDEDTQLPREAARRLIGTLAHPLNQPILNSSQTRVLEGYGVLQPRLTITTESAGRSLFARTFAGQAGLDPYPTAVSDIYQDVFHEGIYMGKGIYEVDAFINILDGHFPENSILSHDLIEGTHVRAGMVTDVELVDDFPSSHLAAACRMHRWVRGDWQLLPWLLPTLRNSSGERVRNPITNMSRWKILDNMRRSLVPPALLLLLLLGLTVLPGSPGVWLGFVLLALILPIVSYLTDDTIASLRLCLKGNLQWFVPDLRLILRQIVMSFVQLPHHACLMMDAVIRTILRLTITRKCLLEWQTAAVTERKSRISVLGFVMHMWPACIVAVVLMTLSLTLAPQNLPWAVPVGVLWLASPLLAYWVSQPEKRVKDILTEAEQRELLRLARKTWQFFAEHVGPADHDLPPDNFQENVEPGEAEGAIVAHRTSPTNIGMYLLSVLSAHDLGFIGPLEMLERCERTMDTLEILPGYAGHPYNWYDTTTLMPLEPRYVSTVDTGNLLAAMLALKQGFSEFVDLPGKGVAMALALDYADPAGQEAVEGFQRRCLRLIDRLEAYIHGVDFSFLYDKKRNLLAIGYHASAGRLDTSYYDLLASEARVASFVAIAKGDVPVKHWFHLGRGVRQLSGRRALVSWNGTMFEYLMALLVMRNFCHTLLAETCATAVQRQREYAHRHRLPWGVSESGFNARDLQFNYQYYAFGIPTLGLRRGLSADKVVAPYATMLALAVDPVAAMKNLRTLIANGLEGRYGLYEAVDYTPERLPAGQSYEIVRSFMAHHQGMSLAAMNNALNDNVMQDRFHKERIVRATELLLQEHLPRRTAIVEPPITEEKLAYRAPQPVAVPIVRHFSSPHTIEPEGHLLSNGSYTVLVTTTGAGFSRHGDTAITRWREDFTQDQWGTFFYIRDLVNDYVWSATYQPIGSNYAEPAMLPETDTVMFAADRVEFARRIEDIESHLEVIVSPEHDAEIRRISLSNHGRMSRRLDLISYLEVVLGPAAADLEHPAFSNLFVETRFIPERNALLCTRRPRTPDEKPPYVIHVIASEHAALAPTRCETDRGRFLGRGRTTANPLAVEPQQMLSNTTGAVLDPILSLRTRVQLEPGETIQVAFTTGFAETEQDALHLINLYHTVLSIERAFIGSWTHNQMELRHLGLSPQKSHLMQQLASRICYPGLALQARAQMIEKNHRGQSGLWGLSISGDYPILLVRISREEELDLVRDALQAHQFMREKGIATDLVILNEHRTEYFQTLQEQIRSLIRNSHARELEDKPGGVYSRHSESISEEERVLLQAVARVTLNGAAGSLKRQLETRIYETSLPRVLAQEHVLREALEHMPILPASLKAELDRRFFELPLRDRFRPRTLHAAPRAVPWPKPELQFFNGLGGFTADAHEYRILLQGDAQTPAPWINILANPHFGTLVSESGSGYTWSINARENRISPWSDDPVSDPPGEVLYLRDEDTGEFWTPTPLPIREPEDYLIRHGQGYTVFEHFSHDIDQELTVFVPVDSPVKIFSLRLRNASLRHRTLSATFYVEWVLGVNRERNRQFTVTDVDLESGIQIARNAYRVETFASRLAFLDVVGVPTRELTSDRTEFTGRNGRLSAPSALFRVGLSGRMGAGYDPCAATQVKLEIEPGETQEILFVLGETANIKEARELVYRFRTPGEAQAALQRVHDFWNGLLDSVQVKTPDPALDLMLNRWLLYQVVSSRLFGRTGFYQSGGAYGFRDQLQDVMALVYAAPYLAREQILRAAARQYLEGDVQHWWHTPTGLGVRTHCSDDYLWLPYVTADYVKTTGDTGVLDELVPYLQDRPLDPNEKDRANVPEVSELRETLYQHALRALERAIPLVGEHGLPLMGSGDWNDSMNLVGDGGKGESVWLGWFLASALARFAPLCEARGDNSHALEFQVAARKLVENIEKHAWDGEWYRRAYTDDEEPLGSAQSRECSIDSISQSWSVISGLASLDRTRQAMAAVDHYLIKRAERLILLLTPPFETSPLEPGYIKGYPPGVRENGGQYTHGATWVALATALLGNGDGAAELLSLLNPVNHARRPEDVALYRVEPYAVAADIYGAEPYTGRGGWTWYTGSAAWVYRIAMEAVLGLHLDGNALVMDPCIPHDWPGFRLTNHFFSTTYEISLENPHNVSRGVVEVWLDGELQENGRIVRVDDGATHHVRVVLGPHA